MTAERWRQVREILYAASEMDLAQQTGFLQQACAGDSDLHAEVERLLGALHQSGSFLEPEGSVAKDLEGSKIGHYRILSQAGRGGMGVVYRAVRDDDYRQEVALKLVLREMESSFLRARFRQERQALALLNHPNIARLLDGGTTEDGQPYLVMEWVSGQPIAEYCEQHELNARQRVALFLEVCQAVAHAHRNLVVHRDLKPSNILIAEDGRPKLLDFGIAKIFSPAPVGERDTLTLADARMLTPDYASPEQVRGETVTTATDVYSLGAVLYELLTAQRPHKLDTRTPAEIERVVCTQDVARPSLAAASSRVPASELRGDLDNIVLKALEKDPVRRYSHVDELSDDLRRYLEGRPVLARSDSVWYRVSKFTRRNKLMVGAAAAIVLALAAGLVVALWQARVAHRERAAAEQRFELARKVAGSLMFEVHDEISELTGASRARELILRQSLAYLDALSKDTGANVELERDLANGYERVAVLQGNTGAANLGSTEAARASLQKALALRRRVLATDPNSVEFRRELARTERQSVTIFSNSEEKLRYAEAAVSTMEGLVAERPKDPALRAELAASEHAMALSLTAEQRYPEAIAYYRKALSHAAGSDPANVALYHKRLGALLIVTKDLDSALNEYQAAIALDEQRVRTTPANARAKMDLSFDYSDRALLFLRMNNTSGAIEQYRQAERIRKDLVAADARDARAARGLVSVSWRLGIALAQAGDRTASEAAFLRGVHAAEVMIRTLPDKRIGETDLAETCLAYAKALRQQWHSCQAALSWLTRAREMARDTGNAAQLDAIEREVSACEVHR